MKTLKKILKITGASLLTLIILLIVFKNQVAILMIHSDMAKKARKPYTELAIPPINDSVFNLLSVDFERDALSPADYIINEFNVHDIILLGENHRISHDYRFVADLIPLLYQEGIKDLALEFSLNRDSLLIRDLLTNSSFFDEGKARQVLFNLSPFMGFQEVLDIYRAAWELNRTIPEGEEKFMIHGIMHPTDFSLLNSEKEKEDREIMLKVRQGVENPELYMAECIINDLTSKGRKALVFCGMHHAFSGYEGHGNRTGVLLKKVLGDRVITVSLHYPWPGKKSFSSPGVYPANGYIDAFIRRYDNKNRQFGIRVSDNSFGQLNDTTSYYSLSPLFTLSGFCDGYIYLGPFSEITSVATIKRFITRDNLEQAKMQLPNPEIRNGAFRFFGAPAYNALISMDSDLEIRYRHLE